MQSLDWTGGLRFLPNIWVTGCTDRREKAGMRWSNKDVDADTGNFKIHFILLFFIPNVFTAVFASKP